MRTIYDRWLYGTGIGYATSLNGDFAACSSSQFSYHGEMELHPLGTVSGAAFTHRITRALRSHGWRVYPQKFIEAAPPARVYSYGVTQGMTGGLMYVVAGQPGHALQARFEFQSQCFKLSGQAPGSPGRLPLPHTADQPRQTGRAGTL